MPEGFWGPGTKLYLNPEFQSVRGPGGGDGPGKGMSDRAFDVPESSVLSEVGKS